MNNKQDSPFGGLDKLLLSSTQTKKQSQEEIGHGQGNKETRKQPSKQTSLPVSKEASQEVSGLKPLQSAATDKHELEVSQTREMSAAIDFEPDPPRKQRLYRKQTFELSKEELEFLEEAKFQLRELEVTKNEIVRTALELLTKDYQGNKETSFLVRKFTNKQGNKLTD